MTPWWQTLGIDPLAVLVGIVVIVALFLAVAAALCPKR